MKDIIKTKYNGLKVIKKGELITLASRPDVGKTLFAFNVAVNVASQNKKVKIFNLEWPSKQLNEQIDIIKDGYYNKKKVIDDNLFINTNPNLKIDTLIEESKGYDLIILDSITIMLTSNENEEEIMSKLRKSAKLLNIGIIIISELPRSVDERKDRHPIISDLNESITNNSDRVIFMYREWLTDSNDFGLTELLNINLKNALKEISYLSRLNNRIVFKNINKNKDNEQ